jgi:hypothetical protein
MQKNLHLTSIFLLVAVVAGSSTAFAQSALQVPAQSLMFGTARRGLLGSMVPRLESSLWMTLPDAITATYRPTDMVFGNTTLRVEMQDTTRVLSPNDSVNNYFRASAVNTWDWVGVGVGTATLGLAAVFFQLGGSTVPNYLPRFSGVTAAEDPNLVSIGAFSLRYDALGSLTLRTGLSTLSNNLFRLLFAPRDNRTVRYMRTYITEVQGGWLFGLQTTM